MQISWLFLYLTNKLYKIWQRNLKLLWEDGMKHLFHSEHIVGVDDGKNLTNKTETYLNNLHFFYEEHFYGARELLERYKHLFLKVCIIYAEFHNKFP